MLLKKIELRSIPFHTFSRTSIGSETASVIASTIGDVGPYWCFGGFYCSKHFFLFFFSFCIVYSLLRVEKMCSNEQTSASVGKGKKCVKTRDFNMFVNF